MSLGLIAEKCGMTRLLTETGSVPVTVLQVNNRIAQLKTLENDGYCAAQVASGERSVSKLTKPVAGHYAKAKVASGRVLREFRLTEEEMADLTLDTALTPALFEVGQLVDVTGVSRGKGFAGVVKRWNFATTYRSGHSLAHRKPGSIGHCQTPGRVFKNKKMPGRMGNVRKTVQSQEIVSIDEERGLIFVKGGVPGAPGGVVIVSPATKAKKDKG